MKVISDKFAVLTNVKQKGIQIIQIKEIEQRFDLFSEMTAATN